jgi:hypothetical protein
MMETVISPILTRAFVSPKRLSHTKGSSRKPAAAMGRAMP